MTVLAAAAFAAAGCAIPQVPSRTVYEDPVNFVRLELDANVLPEWPPGHFTHPAQFSHEQVRRVLMGLTVQEHQTSLQRWIAGESRRLPMFRDAEIMIPAAQGSVAAT